MMKKPILYLILLPVLLILINCQERSLPHSAGRRDSIILIAPEMLEVDSLVGYLEQPRFYPTREEFYSVDIFSPAKLEQYQYWRNIIVAGRIKDDYMKNILSEEALNEVESKGGGLYHEQNLWVELQSVIVVAGRSMEEVQATLEENMDLIFNIFRERERERFNKVLYLEGYEKDASDKMEGILGAYFKIPFAYSESKNEDNFMTYIRKNPDRLVTLLYSEDSITDPISFRDSIFARYFNGDEVSTRTINVGTQAGEDRRVKLTRIDTVDFRGKRAIKLQGVWHNYIVEGGPMGGPFVSYVFEKDGIWYFLDGHVFAPGKKKWPYLQEVDLILHTFKKGF